MTRCQCGSLLLHCVTLSFTTLCRSPGAFGYRSFTEQYLDSCGLFKDAVISILATIAKQERVRLSERTIAGLQRARLQGRIGGRPRIQYDHNRLAELRRSGLSLGQIASETGLSKTTVARLVSA